MIDVHSLTFFKVRKGANQSLDTLMTWVKDIFLMILSLTFFQILLPDSSLARYLKFIFSLILLIVIVEPISGYILQALSYI